MIRIHPNKTAMDLTKVEGSSDLGSLSSTHLLVQLNYTCQCCGLKSRPHKKAVTGYIEVVDFDGSPTAFCTMCMQAIHLSRKHQSYNHGLIIYSPSLSQGQINRIAQMLYLAKLLNSTAAQRADQLINNIQAKGIAPLAETFPGLKTGALSEFINLWQYASPRIKQNQKSLFNGLRYWPFEIPFRRQLKFWHAATFNHLNDHLGESQLKQ